MQQFRCPTCGATFATEDEMEDHQRGAHRGAGRRACPECGATFASQTELDEHGRLQHQRA